MLLLGALRCILRRLAFLCLQLQLIVAWYRRRVLAKLCHLACLMIFHSHCHLQLYTNLCYRKNCLKNVEITLDEQRVVVVVVSEKLAKRDHITQYSIAEFISPSTPYSPCGLRTHRCPNPWSASVR